MTDRTELLEAALDSLPDGLALVDLNENVAFWNCAAANMTGYAGTELLGRPVRDAMERLIAGGARQWMRQTEGATAPGRASLVQVRHRLGHDLRAMVRILVLRDGLGSRIGAAALFHPAERLDALPQGACREGGGMDNSRVEFQDRLEAEFEDCDGSQLPLGVVWITVDQAHVLRRTHGASACEAMLEKVAHVVSNGLRPGEEMGRWGDDEFLVVAHERTAEMLQARAQTLAGLTRTAEFRWWGDRLSLSASAGAAQAEGTGTLAELLESAQSAMRCSIRMGGNHVTQSPGRQPCSPS